MQAKHTILKQSVTFNFEGRTDALALRQQVQDWCQLELLPEMEKQLDLLAGPGAYLRIDKLAVDAVIHKQNWKQEIKQVLMNQFKEQIVQAKSTTKNQQTAEDQTEADTDELIFFYLRFGYLPWWGSHLVKKDFSSTLQNWLSREVKPARAKQLLLQLQNMGQDIIVERFRAHQDAAAFSNFIATLFPGQQIIGRIYNFLKEVMAALPIQDQKNIWQQYFKYLLQDLFSGKDPQPEKLLRVVQEKIAIIGRNVLPSVVLKKEADARLSALWQQLHHSPTSKQHKIEMTEQHDHQTINIVANGNIFPADAIYIENAGAIIIAAFLPQLFKSLNLVEGKRLTDPPLTACCIQFAVSGINHFAEYELVLPKILSGLPAEEFVDTNHVLTEEQIGLVEEMLTAILTHWSALKNTSIAALRETFLKRAGKIHVENGSLYLTVERKTVDILIDQIPWNINLTKLPWMQELLYTQWI